MPNDHSNGRLRFGVKFWVTTLVLAAWAMGAAAQNPLTQLVTGKPKPAQATAAAGSAAVPAPAAQPVAEPAAPQVIPLPEVAMQLEQLTQTLISISASLPADDQLQALSSAISEYGSTDRGQAERSRQPARRPLLPRWSCGNRRPIGERFKPRARCGANSCWVGPMRNRLPSTN